MGAKAIKRFYLLVALTFILSGCASVRHAIPPDLLSNARVFGMQDTAGRMVSRDVEKDFA